MNDTESRKSMDDVLASIRKIVRAEKAPEHPENVAQTPPEPIESDAFPPTAEDSTPLSLTPDMMMDRGAESASTEENSQVSEAIEQNAEPVPSMNDDSLREIVRDVVLEQLKGSDADELIRNVIRQELTTGEIGGNISKNVLRLIQNEVGKVLKK